MNNEYDFESMRQQMSMLKNKLNQQEILNDRLIRRSMRDRVSNINRLYYIMMAVALFMIPYSYWVFVKSLDFSIAFWIGTCVFMLICAGATFYNSHKISDPGMMSHSLVEARKKVASAKKFDADWLFVGIPGIILWLGWFAYELYQQNGLEFTGAFWGGCIGAVIGTVLGFKLHFKTQRQYQDIIDQIEDLTSDN